MLMRAGCDQGIQLVHEQIMIKVHLHNSIWASKLEARWYKQASFDSETLYEKVQRKR